jgi:ligand-binding SRPBCC domain-containing protein
VYTLQREISLMSPRDEVFRFFERPENLARLTPPELGFEIMTPPPLTMRAGAVVDYSIGILGVRMHWRTLISEYDPPHRFVDMQLKGPYTFWHHTHEFEAVGGGTLMRDTVRYVLPFGPIGRLIHKLLVSRRLNNIFDYRERTIRQLLLEDRAGGAEKRITK